MAAAAPSLAAAARVSRASPLTLWHLLSLDAPTVATVWTWFLARTTHTRLPATLLPAMFLAVWILYALDRMLDARMLDPGKQTGGGPCILQLRHRFHHVHRRAFGGAIFFATAILIPAVAMLPRAMLHLYLALAAILLVWFVAIHTLKSTLPKELVVGFFFGAAAFLPSASDSLVLAAVLFANLCSLNCLHIYAWESELHAAEAHATTRFGLRIRRPLTLISALLPLALIVFLPALPWPIPIALALAAAALAVLDRRHRAMEPTTLRAAADLVLLTPLALLPFLR